MPLYRRVFRPGRVGLIFAALAVAAAGSSLLGLRAQTIEPSPLQLSMTPVQVAAYLDAVDRHLSYVPFEVVVKFKDGVSPAAEQRALMAMRSRPAVDELRWKGPVAIASDLGQPDANILAAQLREQPEVQYAEPNYLYYTDFTPNDPSYANRQWNFPAIDMTRAWDINPGATSGITVAVVDTGVTTTSQTQSFKTWNGAAIVTASVPVAVSPDISASRFVSAFDFQLTNSATVIDTGGHGTHVASTIGEETNNSLNLAGMAYNAKIMPIKVLACYWDLQFLKSAAGIPGFQTPFSSTCTGSNAVIAQGVRYAADNGAKVINMSLGGSSPSVTMQDALGYANGKGAFIAVAAGNEYDGGNPVHYPAKYGETMDGVITVASVGRTLRHAYYSNAGSYVEIAAPGGDTVAGGAAGGIYQLTIRASDSDPATIIFPRFDQYDERSFQGTSMATPHVAGLAALIASQLGTSVSPALIEEIIKRTARACDPTSCDPATATGTRARNDFFGAGLIQPRTALFGVGLRK